MKKTRKATQQILATLMAFALATTTLVAAAGCSGGSTQDADETQTDASSDDPITFVWLPDNSSSDLSASREAMAALVEEATGRECEIMTTTDYNVAIEAIVSGTAQIALLGAEGYTQANEKNDAVQCAFTDSDEDGTLEGACYYSRICVRADDAESYLDESGEYSLDNLEGCSFSFVSSTSTSGFAVPSELIVDHFGLDSSDVLLEEGEFFSTVMFGDSHQGSAVNLLSGLCDAAAFNDVDTDLYTELVSGEENAVGSVYKIADDAEAPFDSVQGEQFTLIAVSPVLNAPFCYNTDELTEDECAAITAAFCSEETASNTEIFADPDDEEAAAIFTKDSEDMCFVEVEDAWYDPIRELS